MTRKHLKMTNILIMSTLNILICSTDDFKAGQHGILLWHHLVSENKYYKIMHYACKINLSKYIEAIIKRTHKSTNISVEFNRFGHTVIGCVIICAEVIKIIQRILSIKI